VEVSLSIGQYNDKVSCDVVPIEATHILLGRSWQFDTKVIHDGFINKMSFMHNNKKIILKSLSPRHVWGSNEMERKESAREERWMKHINRVTVKHKKRAKHMREKRVDLWKWVRWRSLYFLPKPFYVLYGKNNILIFDHFNKINLPSSVESPL